MMSLASEWTLKVKYLLTWTHACKCQLLLSSLQFSHTWKISVSLSRNRNGNPHIWAQWLHNTASISLTPLCSLFISKEQHQRGTDKTASGSNWIDIILDNSLTPGAPAPCLFWEEDYGKLQEYYAFITQMEGSPSPGWALKAHLSVKTPSSDCAGKPTWSLLTTTQWVTWPGSSLIRSFHVQSVCVPWC